MTLPFLQLKKGEDRRIRAGHPWIYSNEVDTKVTPLKSFTAGDEVVVLAHDKTPVGRAYVNPHSLISARLFTQDANQNLDLELIATPIHQPPTFPYLFFF